MFSWASLGSPRWVAAFVAVILALTEVAWLAVSRTRAGVVHASSGCSPSVLRPPARTHRALPSYLVDTGATPDWPSEPTRHDQLLYGIGRVCEVHVLLDWNLGMLQAELAILANPSDPEQAFRPTLGTATRIDRCKELLPKSALPEDLRTAGDDALEEAREANERRNRVVHDAWLERIEAEDGPAFNRVRIGKAGLTDEPSDLAYVHDADDRLARVRGRVNALSRAMNRLRNAAGRPMPEGLSYQELLPVIRGERPLDEDA